MLGLKLEVHKGDQDFRSRTSRKKVEPASWAGSTKWFLNGSEGNWKAATKTAKTAAYEIKSNEHASQIGTFRTDANKVISEIKKLERIADRLKMKTDTFNVKADKIAAKASSKFKVSSCGNKMELTGGHAKFARGGNDVTVTGVITVKGTEVKFESARIDTAERGCAHGHEGRYRQGRGLDQEAGC